MSCSIWGSRLVVEASSARGVSSLDLHTNMSVAVENIAAELEKARESLKGVDENIRKIIGRDPTEARFVHLHSLSFENNI